MDSSSSVQPKLFCVFEPPVAMGPPSRCLAFKAVMFSQRTSKTPNSLSTDASNAAKRGQRVSEMFIFVPRETSNNPVTSRSQLLTLFCKRPEQYYRACDITALFDVSLQGRIYSGGSRIFLKGGGVAMVK